MILKRNFLVTTRGGVNGTESTEDEAEFMDEEGERMLLER